MRVFGNLMNRIQEGAVEGKVEVGTGVTILSYSDRDAGTIVEIIPFKSGPNKGKPRILKVQHDKATRTDNNGMSECQDYTFERDPEGRIETFKANLKGVFVGLRIGSRDKYHDYSF